MSMHQADGLITSSNQLYEAIGQLIVCVCMCMRSRLLQYHLWK